MSKISDRGLIYLDCAASAPAFSGLENARSLNLANPSAQHVLGVAAAQQLCDLRKRTARLLHCHAEQVLFCSGATEANNLALYNQLLPKLLRCKAVESSLIACYSDLDHPSSAQLLKRLKDFGLTLQRISLSHSSHDSHEANANGQKNQQEASGRLLLGRCLQKYLPFLCSITAVDSESGRKQDLAELACEIQASATNTYFHVDLAQYIACESGRRQLAELGPLLENTFDSMAISGQKIGAGRGAAILLQRKPASWSLSQGGGQEGGQRSGTENLAAIHALVDALEQQAEQRNEQLSRSAEFLEILEQYPNLHLQPSYRAQMPQLFSPFIFSIAAPPLPSEVLQRLLSKRGYIVGTGSACSSKMAKNRQEKFHAQGYHPGLLPSTLRISFGNGASYPSWTQLQGLLQCLTQLQDQYS